MSFESEAAKAHIASLEESPKLYIADGLCGYGKAPWDSIDKKWKRGNFKFVFELAQASKVLSVCSV